MFYRHDILYFKRDAIDFIVDNAICLIPDAPKDYLDELYENIGARIPAIVKRQENPREGYVEIGLSSPYKIGNNRLRVSSLLPVNSIKDRINPFEVIENTDIKDTEPFGRIINELKRICSINSIKVGLYGSQALEMLTGLGYTSSSSDLDIIVEGNIHQLSLFQKHVKKLQLKQEVSIDIEARIYMEYKSRHLQSYDVKLKELLSLNNLVMLKSISDVILIERGKLLA